MIESYVELRIKPDVEFTTHELMSALFLKLHIAISEIALGKIGLSFPDYSLVKKDVGERIRIFSSTDIINKLYKSNWYSGLRDYLAITSPNTIPVDCSWGIFKRVQLNSFEKQRKRMIRRKGLSYAETLSVIPKELFKKVDLPCICVKSLSTCSLARVYIKYEIKDAPTQFQGEFSSYGLSSTSPVPIFN